MDPNDDNGDHAIRDALSIAERRVTNARHLAEAHAADAARTSAKLQECERRVQTLEKTVALQNTRMDALCRYFRAGVLRRYLERSKREIQRLELEIVETTAVAGKGFGGPSTTSADLRRRRERMARLRKEVADREALLGEISRVEATNESLRDAVFANDRVAVGSLLVPERRADVNHPAGLAAEEVRGSRSGRTAFEIACRLGRVDIVGAFLSRSADVDGDLPDPFAATGRHGPSPLALACASGDDGRTVRTLLHAGGACPFRADETGRNALHEACGAVSVGAVEAILDAAHADGGSGDGHRTLVNAADHQGNTALHILCTTVAVEERRHHSIVIGRMLLDAGFNLHLQNLEGKTPLEIAIGSRNIPMVELFKKVMNRMEQ